MNVDPTADGGYSALAALSEIGIHAPDQIPTVQGEPSEVGVLKEELEVGAEVVPKAGEVAVEHVVGSKPWSYLIDPLVNLLKRVLRRGNNDTDTEQDNS